MWCGKIGFAMGKLEIEFGSELGALQGLYGDESGESHIAAQIFGPTGSGKTELTKQFLRRLPEGTSVARVDVGITTGVRDVMEGIGRGFGLLEDHLFRDAVDGIYWNAAGQNKLKLGEAVRRLRDWSQGRERPVVVLDCGSGRSPFRGFLADYPSFTAELTRPRLHDKDSSPVMVVTVSRKPLENILVGLRQLYPVSLPMNGVRESDLVKAGIPREQAMELMRITGGHPAAVAALYGNGGGEWDIKAAGKLLTSGRYFGIRDREPRVDEELRKRVVAGGCFACLGPKVTHEQMRRFLEMREALYTVYHEGEEDVWENIAQVVLGRLEEAGVVEKKKDGAGGVTFYPDYTMRKLPGWYINNLRRQLPGFADSDLKCLDGDIAAFEAWEKRTATEPSGLRW